MRLRPEADRDAQTNQTVHTARLEERINAIHNILEERDKAVALAYTSMDKARDHAQAAQAAVNALQNEFRGALKDQQSTLATKDEVQRLVDRVAGIERTNAVGGGRALGIDASRDFMFKTVPIILSGIAIAAAILIRSS